MNVMIIIESDMDQLELYIAPKDKIEKSFLKKLKQCHGKYYSFENYSEDQLTKEVIDEIQKSLYEFKINIDEPSTIFQNKTPFTIYHIGILS